MPTPRRGDPRRPLHLAASSCRVLGALALLSGTCTGAGMFSRVAYAGGRGGLLPAAVAFGTLGLYLGVGVAYFVFATYLKRRRFWAVVAALSLTGVIALLVLVGVAAQAAMLVVAPLPMRHVFLVFAGIEVLVLLALGQVIYHLARSFEAIKHVAPDEGRGFDVLLPVTDGGANGPLE